MTIATVIGIVIVLLLIVIGYLLRATIRLLRSIKAGDAWIRVAEDSNRDIDQLLREYDPTLPKHYGMPVDGIRMAFARNGIMSPGQLPTIHDSVGVEVTHRCQCGHLETDHVYGPPQMCTIDGCNCANFEQMK